MSRRQALDKVDLQRWTIYSCGGHQETGGVAGDVECSRVIVFIGSLWSGYSLSVSVEFASAVVVAWTGTDCQVLLGFSCVWNPEDMLRVEASLQQFFLIWQK